MLFGETEGQKPLIVVVVTASYEYNHKFQVSQDFAPCFLGI